MSEQTFLGLDSKLSIQNLNEFNQMLLLKAFIDGPIFNNCFDVYEVVEICLEVPNIQKACIEVKLVGVSVGKTCVNFSIQGDVLIANFESDTLNSGIWKLEKPRFRVEQNLSTGDGALFMTAILYKLRLSGYKEKRKWENEKVQEW